MDVSRIAAELADIGEEKDLPVEAWSPKRQGDIDIVIKTDGTWLHEGAIINRPQLVRLFSRVLRHDDDGYALVTPVEKLRIRVEDVPFIVTDINRRADGLHARTNVGDEVLIGPEHPLEMRATADKSVDRAPYIRIRGGLWARIGRAAYYRLVSEESCEENERLSIESGGETFCLGTVQ